MDVLNGSPVDRGFPVLGVAECVVGRVTALCVDGQILREEGILLQRCLFFPSFFTKPLCMYVSARDGKEERERERERECVEVKVLEFAVRGIWGIRPVGNSAGSEGTFHFSYAV